MIPKTEVSNTEKRQQALERAVSQIDKQFGKGSIMKLGSETKLDVPAISTGALSLDIALGVGGIPRGNLWTGIFRQNHFDVTSYCKCAKGRRDRCIYRCRTCPGPRILQKAGC